jgi:hypothetical protein
MDTKQVVEGALALIRAPENFSQRAYARDGRGNQMYSGEIESEAASSFCSVGAIFRVAGVDSEPARRAIRLLGLVADRIYPDHTIIDVNDWFGHAAVIRVFEAAIKEATDDAA